MPLVGGADVNGTASGDPTDLRFDRPYRSSPTGLWCMDRCGAAAFPFIACRLGLGQVILPVGGGILCFLLLSALADCTRQKRSASRVSI
eukprot:5039037-Pleurochrysis_carterae.AAC.4